MKGWLIVVFTAAVLAACEPAPLGEQAAVGDSPIASFDKTRLWILVRAARVGNGRKCADYYRAPDDVRYRGLQQTCEAWTLNFADFLRLNGLPSIEAAHLRELVYWEWYETTRQSILDCQTKYVPTAFNAEETQEQRLTRTKAKYACDPWDDATKNDKQSPEDLGIQFK